MSSLKELYNTAFDLLEAAINADNSQNLDGSISGYKQALASFSQVLKLEPDESKRQIVDSRIKEYSRRLAELQESYGNKGFAKAISLEEQGKATESLDDYMKAVESYFDSLKLYDSQDDHQTQLRKRVAGIIDRVESIKRGGKSPSSRPPSSFTLDLDFLLPPSTGPGPSSPPTTTTFTNTTKPITPHHSAGPVGSSHPPPLPPLAPTSTTKAPSPSAPPPTSSVRRSALSESEIEVLKGSSVINGKTFMPWLEGEEDTEKFRYEPGFVFTDPEGLLPLSPEQSSRLAGWKRPSQFVKGGKPKMIKLVSPWNIEQELVTDCSFIASLCICAAFERRFNRPLITKIIYPQSSSGVPVYNPSGKYMVKLWANGVPRKVIVDDRLPVDARGNLICSSSKDKTELWPSIIEKAYMQLNGGYDFPGSNSGIDLFALTGWLPEQIHFEHAGKRSGSAAQTITTTKSGVVLDHRQSSGRAWERLKSACQFGDCLTTVSTGVIDEAEANSLGLVPTHAYACLDVKEVLGGQRFLLIKNPWSRKRWKGPFSATDRQRWTPALGAALGYDPVKAQESDDGVSWIEWVVTHALWPVILGPRNDTFTLGKNPQYQLIVEKSKGAGSIGQQKRSIPSVWILLSRHTTSKEATLEAGDFLTVHVYRPERRVIYPTDDAFIRGLYSNNPHSLVRLDVNEDDEGRYALVLSQLEKVRDVSYTLTVMSTAPFRFSVTRPLPELVARQEGAWDSQSAGGRLGLATFLHNPQFSLVINRSCMMYIELLAPKEYYIGISVIGGPRGGRRVDSILQGEEVMTSNAYRQGFCYAQTDALEPGLYTIVVSTYENNLKGNFVLNLHSTAPVQSTAVLLLEGDGMAKQVVSGTWSFADGTAGGCSSRYLSNPIFLLTCTERTSLLLRLSCPENEALNLTVFKQIDTNNDLNFPAIYPGLPAYSVPTSDNALATSCNGIYTASRGGVSIPSFDLDKGSYFIVIATYNTVEASYLLTIYSRPKPVNIRRVVTS